MATVETHPYEFLVRWDANGKLQGAHVQWRHVIKDDAGAIVGESLSNAEPVGENGFPLDNILSQTQIDALARIGELDEKTREMEKANETLASKLELAQKEKSSK